MDKIYNFCKKRIYLIPSGVTSYLILKSYYSDLPGISCPFRQITGIPCPSCYLTRSTCFALQGDLGSSFRMHAFGPVFALLIIIWSIKSIKNKKLFPFLINEKYLVITTISLIIYWIFRLYDGFPDA
tara:strand:+ start:29098 stop:29478 length:381 start_codon:yes stop_codon:yes gene_type:complete